MLLVQCTHTSIHLLLDRCSVDTREGARELISKTVYKDLAKPVRWSEKKCC